MSSRTVVLLVLLLGACSSLGFALLPNLWNSAQEASAEKQTSPQPARLSQPSGLLSSTAINDPSFPIDIQYQAAKPLDSRGPRPSGPRGTHSYQPRKVVDTSGSGAAFGRLKPWKDPTSLEEIRDAFVDLGHRTIAQADTFLTRGGPADANHLQVLLFKAVLFLFEGEAKEAYKVLQQGRSMAESSSVLAETPSVD